MGYKVQHELGSAEKQHKRTAEQMFWYTADLIKCHILAIRGISVHFNQLGTVHKNSRKC